MSARESTAAPCALPGTPLADARSGIDACVHCGFCLQACPTYLALDDENDSPRGRIVLMRLALEGKLALDSDSLNTHIDRCLGCRACETACPSGVPYGQILEATRATKMRARPLPFVARMLLAVFARPALMRLALGAGRIMRDTGLAALMSRLGGRLGFSMSMLSSTKRAWPGASYAAAPATRGNAVILEGCVMESVLTETNRATERVLGINGFAVRRVGGQACCGALHAHAGDLAAARRMAKRNIAAFEQSGDATIVVNAAGCGSMMKEYDHLLADDPAWAPRAAAVAKRVRDVTEVLSSGPMVKGRLEARVTYDAPCHLVHAQRVSSPPLTVLSAIEGMTFVPLPGADRCCGSAGIYNLVEPEVSAQVLAPKIDQIELAGVDFVTTGNPGCLMQIGAGLRQGGSRTRAVHPVDLLDASYARASARPS